MSSIIRLTLFLALFITPLLPCAYAEFAPVVRGKPLQFPRDHGVHPSFKTEWWYFTGHLMREGEALYAHPSPYGFQLTFFRQGRDELSEKNHFRDNYLAHGALTVVHPSPGLKQGFYHESKVYPGTLGIAGARSDALDVWNHQWRARQEGKELTLAWSVEGRLINLKGTMVAPVVHGQQGFSKKSDCEACASYYYSLPRLTVTGTIEYQGVTERVHGVLWMDHEVMTAPLASDRSGWDWISLTSAQGWSLMGFQVRAKEEGAPVYRSGTFIDARGKVTPLSRDEIQLTPLNTWKSAESGGDYPLTWRVQIPRFKIDETIAPLLEDQEIRDSHGPTYWEGAVANKANSTKGYLELTGYGREF
jgi:predicted secreted hydrolase